MVLAPRLLFNILLAAPLTRLGMCMWLIETTTACAGSHPLAWSPPLLEVALPVAPMALEVRRNLTILQALLLNPVVLWPMLWSKEVAAFAL